MTIDPQFRVGAPAPKVQLDAASGRRIDLADMKGRTVVLVFYPADWSPVCGDELDVFNIALPLFTEIGSVVLGVSVDSVWSHKAFADQHHLRIDLLSDFEPKGSVSREFGMYDDRAGRSKRGLVIIDGDGVVRWAVVYPDDVNPGVDEVLRIAGQLTHTPAGTLEDAR
ncbi:redoxin domain-containing protein [Microbacterium aoyamense]|uniref:Redoxin domain-containing protein n=1 Tax=Microbacterium aoyamense TaxID=344166 RepID=A0ABN2Q0V3_9MICO|nr:redoxin domain-containing protein [Microbacterium aoyamense]